MFFFGRIPKDVRNVTTMIDRKRILIIGGGFGGIATALALVRHGLLAGRQVPPDIKITLVSDKPHFEYFPALYRVVTGKSPLEVCIPLTEIFSGSQVECIVDKITKVVPDEKVAHGASGSRYAFEYLVLALGSETSYFDIPGLQKFSFGFKSITEALRLKRHFHELFSAYKAVSPESRADGLPLLHFVIVGAGASGVELAGELSLYAKRLAKEHGVPESAVEIDLIEAAPMILPAFSSSVALRVADRLRILGVNIFTNRSMVKEETEVIVMRGMEMKADTVIWTAGVKPNEIYKKIKEFSFDKKGKVMVDGYLRATGFPHVFVIGDGASTLYAGMAQTAIHDGTSVAENIKRLVAGEELHAYHPKKPFYSFPVGPGWAATTMGSFSFYGRIGWLMRRLADLRYFFSILPFTKAIAAFRSGDTLCETCPICFPEATKVGPL